MSRNQTILNHTPQGEVGDQNLVRVLDLVGGLSFYKLVYLKRMIQHSTNLHLPTLNTTLDPICDGEGTKIFFQSQKSFSMLIFGMLS